MKKSVHTPEYAALRSELRAIREKAGLSQRDLAEFLKVPHSLIAKIEMGERRIDLIEFCWYVAACGGDPSEVTAKLVAKICASAATRPRKGGRSK